MRLRSALCCASSLLFLVPLSAVVSCAAPPPAPAPAAIRREVPATLAAFDARVAVARRNVPRIVRAAEAAADRIVAHPEALINVPYAPQVSFAEEIVNRSGGLSNALPPADRSRQLTPHDVLLLSVRSWETDGSAALPVLQKARKQGWLIVLFASKAGMPVDLKADHLIDNGAASGGAAEATVNAMANVLNAWLWNCEYVAALTRRGKRPGILESGLLPDGAKHNAQLKTREGRRRLDECKAAVGAGDLARAYLKRVEALSATLAGDPVQGQIDKAARAISKHIKGGGKALFATATHFLMRECFVDTRTPWKPFNVVWRAEVAFPANVHKNDLLVWFSFRGLSSPYEDYGKCIRETGAALVTCYVPDGNAANNAQGALAHIDQSWEAGDAAVPIPFPPGRMAPISGIEQGLLYRMLDAATAERL